MKQTYLMMIPLAILFTGCGVTSSQSGSDKRASKKEIRAEEFEKTAMLVESGNYIYKVRSVTSGRGKMVQITAPYSLKARNGTYEAYLPYFGRAHQADYGGSGGIDFNGSPQDLTTKKDTDKRSITVVFSITDSKDKYNVNLAIGSNGYGSLTITSQRRQVISYYGYVSELEESEK